MRIHVLFFTGKIFILPQNFLQCPIFTTLIAFFFLWFFFAGVVGYLSLIEELIENGDEVLRPFKKQDAVPKDDQIVETKGNEMENENDSGNFYRIEVNEGKTPIQIQTMKDQREKLKSPQQNPPFPFALPDFN